MRPSLLRQFGIGLLGLLCAIGSPAVDVTPIPPLFKVASGPDLGFVSTNGVLVVEPQFAGCARQWTEGFLWVVTSHKEYFSGNFMDARGGWLLPAPAGRFADEILQIPPAFWQGRAILETAPGKMAVATRSGQILPGLEGRDAELFPFLKNGRYGFQDLSGQHVLPARFEKAKPFQASSAPVQLDGQWGLIDRAGHWLRKPDCNDITAGENGFWIAEQAGQLGLLAADGQWVHEPDFLEFRRWGAQAVSVRQEDQWGLLNTANGQMAVPPQYDAIEGLGRTAAWAQKDGKWGLLSYSNTLLQPFEFDSVLWLSPEAGLWRTFQNGRCGLVEESGETLLSCEYAAIDKMTDRFLAVAAETGTGLFDAEQKCWAVAPAYDQVVCWPGFSGKSAAVLSGNRWGLVRLGDEKKLLPMEHDELRPWHGLLMARKDDRLALFDSEGQAVLPWNAETTELPDVWTGMVNGLGKIVCKGKAGLIDAQGTIRLPCEFQDVGIYSEGVAPAQQDGKWGFVTLAGTWRLPPQYAQANAFCEGVAVVLHNGKWGAIDTAGNVRIPFQFDGAGYAFNGRMPVAEEQNGRLLWGLVRTDGTPDLPLEFDALEWIDFPPRVTQIHGRITWQEWGPKPLAPQPGAEVR